MDVVLSPKQNLQHQHPLGGSIPSQPTSSLLAQQQQQRTSVVSAAGTGRQSNSNMFRLLNSRIHKLPMTPTACSQETNQQAQQSPSNLLGKMHIPTEETNPFSVFASTRKRSTTSFTPANQTHRSIVVNPFHSNNNTSTRPTTISPKSQIMLATTQSHELPSHSSIFSHSQSTWNSLNPQTTTSTSNTIRFNENSTTHFLTSISAQSLSNNGGAFAKQYHQPQLRIAQSKQTQNVQQKPNLLQSPAAIQFPQQQQQQQYQQQQQQLEVTPFKQNLPVKQSPKSIPTNLPAALFSQSSPVVMKFTSEKSINSPKNPYVTAIPIQQSMNSIAPFDSSSSKRKIETANSLKNPRAFEKQSSRGFSENRNYNLNSNSMHDHQSVLAAIAASQVRVFKPFVRQPATATSREKTRVKTLNNIQNKSPSLTHIPETLSRTRSMKSIATTNIIIENPTVASATSPKMSILLRKSQTAVGLLPSTTTDNQHSSQQQHPILKIPLKSVTINSQSNISNSEQPLVAVQQHKPSLLNSLQLIKNLKNVQAHQSSESSETGGMIAGQSGKQSSANPIESGKVSEDITNQRKRSVASNLLTHFLSLTFKNKLMDKRKRNSGLLSKLNRQSRQDLEQLEQYLKTLCKEYASKKKISQVIHSMVYHIPYLSNMLFVSSVTNKSTVLLRESIDMNYLSTYLMSKEKLEQVFGQLEGTLEAFLEARVMNDIRYLNGKLAALIRRRVQDRFEQMSMDILEEHKSVQMLERSIEDKIAAAALRGSANSPIQTRSLLLEKHNYKRVETYTFQQQRQINNPVANSIVDMSKELGEFKEIDKQTIAMTDTLNNLYQKIASKEMAAAAAAAHPMSSLTARSSSTQRWTKSSDYNLL